MCAHTLVTHVCNPSTLKTEKRTANLRPCLKIKSFKRARDIAQGKAVVLILSIIGEKVPKITNLL